MFQRVMAGPRTIHREIARTPAGSIDRRSRPAARNTQQTSHPRNGEDRITLNVSSTRNKECFLRRTILTPCASDVTWLYTKKVAKSGLCAVMHHRQIFFTIEVVVAGPEPEPCKTHGNTYRSLFTSLQPELSAFDLLLLSSSPSFQQTLSF